MRAVVIGGTGFIGRLVVRELLRLGHEVAVVHRGSELPELHGLTQITAHRERLADAAPQLRAFAPDVVVDMILSSGRQAEALLDVFRGHAERVVAISSMDVYRACGVLHGTEPGPLEPLPLTEDSSAVRRRLQTYPPAQIAMLQQVFGWLDDEYRQIPVERVVLGDAESARDRAPPADGVPGPAIRCDASIRSSNASWMAGAWCSSPSGWRTGARRKGTSRTWLAPSRLRQRSRVQHAASTTSASRTR